MNKLKSMINKMIVETRRDCLATVVHGYQADYSWQVLGYQSHTEYERDLARSLLRQRAKRHNAL
ncbi:hypothetical protein PTW35_20375 (plasmid) [Photobacterium sp. DA100]|uniref:hypothetical protein n=1 Tax=Photobacterium sp. DA100 TaxID=3027472 RepID=UPI00247A55DB|nr:hypothetical protein [Photobacterium sp. DA100]WEM45438.1 hypothetical protein PTW35_20375 [Photobacterium sp. DA100]